MAEAKADLREQLVRAALECSGGDPNKTFSSEDLLLAAWNGDRAAWGLRGHEQEHPDSHRVHRELDSRGKGQRGIVGSGLLEKVGPRTYRITPKGLAAASESDGGAGARERTDRVLEAEIARIVSHPAFIAWLKDPDTPRQFRDAGHFWGIAPGTPPRVVRQRVQAVEDTLRAALSVLEQKGVQEIANRHGQQLYDETDIARGLEFHRALKERFRRDLAVLAGPEPL
jgi:hypothetical protein